MPFILVSLESGVLELTLNRPEKLNAFNPQMHGELRAALERALDDAEVRAVLLTGAGRGFCAGQDLSERDPKAARESFEAFKELVTRFPESRYAADSIARMRYLVNAMARNEVRVAEYYLRRQAYVAAVNRAQFVLANYQQSPMIEPALIVLVKAYDAMGLNELRDDTARLLKQNFPNSEFSLAMLHKRAWWQIF